MAIYRASLPKKEAKVSENTGLYNQSADSPDDLLKKEASAQKLSSEMETIVENTAALFHAYANRNG